MQREAASDAAVNQMRAALRCDYTEIDGALGYSALAGSSTLYPG